MSKQTLACLAILAALMVLPEALQPIFASAPDVYAATSQA